MKLSLCNEVIRDLDFPRQCAFARAVGYDGLEVAPFTLSDAPDRLSAVERAAVRRAAEQEGIAITGLHWLLIKPDGLSITDPDPAVRARTIAVMREMVTLCAELGGTVLVHGSPKQRMLPEQDPDAARGWAMEALVAAGAAATAAGVTYCLEPLATRETNFVNTVAEAAAIVDAIGEPGLKTMLDCAAAAHSDTAPLSSLLDRWLPGGHIAHVQVNDTNRRGPGEGDLPIAPLIAALRRHGYDRVVAVEPFVYEPDGPACAARAAGYLRGILEALP